MDVLRLEEKKEGREREEGSRRKESNLEGI